LEDRAERKRFRSLYVLFAALFLLVRPAPAQVSQPGASLASPPADQPITPIPPPPKADPRAVALGERLFDDPALSGDGKRACSSCHEVNANGADGKALDLDPAGRPVQFNTNTVFNAALSYRKNWEGNARTLEEAAAMSLSDPQLMASSVPQAVKAAKADPVLRRRFEQAYGRGPDAANLLNAIATYERSLVTPNSRFDLWLKGDKSALSAEELQGYQLFTSFGCISCHQGVNVGGNLFERSGIFHPLGSSKPLLLRVPSLRNVAVTAPYFHDGRTSNLTQAVRQMGYAQLDRRLSDDQVKAVAAFLSTLTGRYQGRLLTQPQPPPQPPPPP
jgi:cytochrome c peroxidase